MLPIFADIGKLVCNTHEYGIDILPIIWRDMGTGGELHMQYLSVAEMAKQ